MRTLRAIPALLCLLIFGIETRPATTVSEKEEVLVVSSEVGRTGGTLTVSERAEPKTLNPITAIDRPSRDVLFRMHSDLIHINRASQRTESSLAKSWTVSKDGRVFTLQLRHGIRFSDGQPFDADDVVFSFQVYLDENVHSWQRDLLLANGQTIAVQKITPYTVRVTLVQPSAPAERLFDSVAMLPKHLLDKAY